jgi:hypothetical protein
MEYDLIVDYRRSKRPIAGPGYWVIKTANGTLETLTDKKFQAQYDPHKQNS